MKDWTELETSCGSAAPLCGNKLREPAMPRFSWSAAAAAAAFMLVPIQKLSGSCAGKRRERRLPQSPAAAAAAAV